jgi:hypothetical protein
MKSTIKLIAVLLLVAITHATVAHADPPARRGKSRILLNDEEERYVRVTGSNIPQRVKLRSIGTTTPYNLRIFTKAELDSTGRFGPTGLGLDPSITITGR